MKLTSYIVAGLLYMLASTAMAQQCNINLAVMPMTQGEDVPAATEDYLLSRLSQMLATEGITTDPLQSQFFISAKFNHINEDITPGPPAQTAIHTFLTLYMGDLASRTVYASTTLELRGVGTTDQRAFINAMRQLNTKNKNVESFIEQGKRKIINYFDKNYHTIIAKARRAAEQHDYQQALWHLISIPECCIGYNEAFALENKYYQAHIDRTGKKLYTAALAKWSSSQDQDGAEEAFALLLEIDPESSAFTKAENLAAEMKASVKSDRDFELRKKYNDSVELEKNRINAIREVGVAFGKGQQPTTTNLMWLK